MARRFSKCPTWWVRDAQMGIQKFGGGKNAGSNISALKCILAISTSIDFHSRKAKLSISDLEALTGLSRPMVIRGLQGLAELGIVEVDKTGVHRENGKNRTISPADSLQALALWRSCLDKGKSGQLRRKRLIYRGPLRTSPPDPRATNVDVYSPRAA